MFLETYKGGYLEVSRVFLQRASRAELVEFLEDRGSACYDDEATELLRACALDDYDTECDGSPR